METARYTKTAMQVLTTVIRIPLPENVLFAGMISGVNVRVPATQ